jgi:hypothetical protein
VAGAGGELAAEQMVVSGGRREDGTVERDLWILDTGNVSTQPRNIGKRGKLDGYSIQVTSPHNHGREKEGQCG